MTLEQGSELGWTTWKISPVVPRSNSDRLVIAIHGGAYVQDIQAAHYNAYADISRRTGASVLAPIYPLAPHGTASTVVPAMADLVAGHVARLGADRVSVIGDSAGAGLALSAIQELVQRDTPVPSRMVLISPWLDATLSDTRSWLIKDPMLNPDGLVAAGKLWAGDLDPADWRVSPLFGELRGLPETAVYAGTLDCLVPDAWRLQERARLEGCTIRFHIAKGLIHSWAGFTLLPEYRQMAPRIARDLLGDPTRDL